MRCRKCAWLACGLAARASSAASTSRSSARTGPRLYWTMSPTQCLGGIPVPLYQDAVAAEMVFVLDNAEIRFAVVEDQEQVDKLLEIRPKVPTSSTSSTTTRAACALRPARARLVRAPAEPRQATAASEPTSSTPRSTRAARRRRGDALHVGHDRQPEGRRAHARQPDRRRRGRRRDRRAHATTRRCSPTCRWRGSGRTLLVRAVDGVRLHASTARVGETVMTDMREIGPTYYFAPPRCSRTCSRR
jgi:long-chain acyl-CoA synthetase